MTIFGWDLSHFDLPSIGDAVDEGFSFFTHKAGGDANDAEIAAWWKSVKDLPTGKALLGAYWVLYPGHGSGAGDAFVARLDATCPGWRNRPFILQLDCEEWNGNSATVPSKTEIKAACDRLVDLMPKLKPIVYAPEWVYGQKLAGLTYPLWASSYVTGSGAASKLYPGDSSTKWHSYSGQTPKILQFTSSAKIAGQTTCDANAYRGTLAELTALVAPGWKTEVPDVELTDKYGDAAYPARTVQDRLSDDAKLRDVLWGDKTGTAAAKLNPASPLARLMAAPTAVDALAVKVAALTDEVTTLAAVVGTGTVPVITQDQLDLAVLNALKTLAGGQS